MNQSQQCLVSTLEIDANFSIFEVLLPRLDDCYPTMTFL